MTSQPLLLTLLYAISATAVIGAINARDSVRMVISSLLAILCLAAAVFHTSRYLALNDVVTPPPAPVVEAPKPPPPPPPDTVGLAASKRETALAQGRTQLRSVLQTARRLQQNLASVNLSDVADVSDEEYQTMQNHAQAYSAEAQNLKQHFAEVTAALPPGLEASSDAISAAIESLISSAHNLERFFKSEDDTEEKERQENFRHGAQAAEAALQKAENRLGSAP